MKPISEIERVKKRKLINYLRFVCIVGSRNEYLNDSVDVVVFIDVNVLNDVEHE